MSDDFRVTVEFSDEEHVSHLGRSLTEQELAEQLREMLGDRLIVTRDGVHVFLYAGSEADGKTAEDTVRRLVEGRELAAEIHPLERWHPIAGEWKPATEGLPETEAAKQAEHDEWEQQETADSLEDDLAEWEIRIELDSHSDASALAKKLTAEGVGPIVRRWKYLLIGAANEDDARTFAARLEKELPSGGEVKVEPAPVWFYEGAGRHPLSVMFGGLPNPGDQK